MIRAKVAPAVPLTDHSEQVGSAVATLLDSSTIVRRLHATGSEIDQKTLRHLGRFTGRHHDTGKANPDWQTAAANRDPLPSHSHLSGLYTLGVTVESADWLTPTQQTAVVLAILHHHTSLTSRNMRPTNRPLRQLRAFLEITV